MRVLDRVQQRFLLGVILVIKLNCCFDVNTLFQLFVISVMKCLENIYATQYLFTNKGKVYVPK